MRPVVVVDCSKTLNKEELENLLRDVYEAGYFDGYSKGFQMGRREEITITPTWNDSNPIKLDVGPSDIPNPYVTRCNAGTDLINEAMQTLAKGKKK